MPVRELLAIIKFHEVGLRRVFQRVVSKGFYCRKAKEIPRRIRALRETSSNVQGVYEGRAVQVRSRYKVHFSALNLFIRIN